MAAALFRRGTGLCVRCVHRELCRVVWRPQTAMFSSKPSDRKQPRITHFKKAKPQPALDVAKLLEQLFSQRRPNTAPPAGKARSIKASSKPAKPTTTSSTKVSTPNVPPLLKTEPAVSALPSTSSFNQVDITPTSNTVPESPQLKPESPTNPETSYSSETPQQSPLNFTQDFTLNSASNVNVPQTSTAPSPVGSEAAATGWQTSSEITETSIETATDTDPVELKTATELPLSAQVVENTETSSFPAAAVEPLIETTRDSPEEASHLPVETLDSRAPVVEAPVEPAIDFTVDTAAETKSTNSGVVDISHSETVEPLVEATVEPSVESSNSSLETRVGEAAVADCPVESTIDATVDAPAQAAQTDSQDSGFVIISHIAEEQLSIENTIDASVETSCCPVETLEKRDAVTEGSVEAEADAAAHVIQTSSTDSGVTNISVSAKEEPLIETTIESALEASTSPLETAAAVSESAVENEAADSLSHTYLTPEMQETPPFLLKNESEPTTESTVDSSSGNVAVEEQVNKSEQMTLESVTLHDVEVLVESLKTDELLQTKLVLDGKAENQLQEVLVQVQTEAAAEPKSSSEDESEILTEALSKWDSLSADLEELEGESGMLVKELLCHVPTVVPKTSGTVETISASNPHVGANGECLQMEEKGTEGEDLTLELVTLSEVKAEVGGLETEALLETRDVLEKEADVVAKEEKMEVKTTEEDVAVVDESTEAEMSTLDTISEATDAIEAETSLMLEAMFGSEQGLRPPPNMLLVDQKLPQQDEAADREAENESGEPEVSVVEAMTLESVTLAEVEASLGTLENESLGKTTDYLEREAEILAGEEKMEVEDVVVEETTEALNNESLSLPEGDALSEDLQTDAIMEELLFCVPGQTSRVTEGQAEGEAVKASILNATVATESVDVDTEATVTDDFPASPPVKEVLLEQEEQGEEEQTEASGNEEGKGTHTDLDPVQRLFLEKIREYRDMRRLNGGPLEAEPDYKKYLSEETAKLQRLYGGGDLNSFPEFTFTEPKMDQDSK